MFVITQTDPARVQYLNYDVAKTSIAVRHLFSIKTSVCAHSGT